MFDALLERRKGKNTPEQVEKMMEDVSYFGTMLVYMGKADGMVSGAVHSTGSTVRPALQIIKTKPNAHRISGAFLMQKGDQRYIFADCAINIELDALGYNFAMAIITMGTDLHQTGIHHLAKLGKGQMA